MPGPMPSGAQRKPANLPGNEADIARKGLVELNRLGYTLQPDLSVVVTRSFKKHFFQQNSYSPGQRAICIFNSGSEYVDPQNSYLSFVLRNTTVFPNATAGTTTFPPVTDDQLALRTGHQGLNLGEGSALNFIRRIVLTSRSGDEIERIERVNFLSPLLERFEKSPGWMSTIGVAAGFAHDDSIIKATVDDNAGGGAAAETQVRTSAVYNWFRQTYGDDASATTYRNAYARPVTVPPSARILNGGTGAGAGYNYFCIPLSCLLGLFRFTDRLLPSMLCSGMRMEIEFEQAATAVCLNLPGGQLPSSGVNWTIQSPEIMLDQYQLTDSIQRVLNEESAMRGLEVTFCTFYNTMQSIGETNEVNMEIRKAVSRALAVIAKTHDQETGTVNDDVLVDHMASRPWEFLQWQMRIGSIYEPQQPVKAMTGGETTPAGTLVESYFQALHGFGKLKTPSSEPTVNINEFDGEEASAREPNYGLGCVVVDLERSNVQKLTGIPINNSRVAELRATLDLPGGPGTGLRRVVDSWLCYVRLLRVFLQNVEVEE